MNNLTSSNAMEELSRFFKILRRHIKLIITSTVLMLAIFAAVLFFVITPKYQSTTQLIVNQKPKNAQAAVQQNQSADIQMINTYKSLITSPVVSNPANQKIANSPGLGNSQVSVGTQSDSQVFDIGVTSSNPDTAAKLANSTASAFQDQAKAIMNAENVTVIAKATPDSMPISPNKKTNLLIGAIVGILVGILLSLFKEYNARTIETTSFITDDLEITNLGIINNLKTNRKKKNK